MTNNSQPGTKFHESVLVSEVVDALKVQKGENYIDATLGNGGHALEIIHLGGKVLGIEVDPKMLAISMTRFEDVAADYKFILGNFINIDKIAYEQGTKDVSGIIYDLGVTNLHLLNPIRGFSFGDNNAELDMRLNPENQNVKASDLLNILREDQLQVLFESTLNPGAAKWLTGRVLFSRNRSKITTVGDLLEICNGLKNEKSQISEATLPFLALRIAVNSELTNLKESLPKAYELLRKGGRLVVISFHSGEDKIVKEFFKEKYRDGSKILTYKPIMASKNEVEKNRRARSAKMRILEKK